MTIRKKRPNHALQQTAASTVAFFDKHLIPATKKLGPPAMNHRTLCSFLLALAFVPSVFAGDAEIVSALKAKGAEVTETKGALTGLSFRDCSALTAGDYQNIHRLGQLKALSFGKGFDDAALKALGALPELESLSTNGMDVSDEGARALATFKKLKSIAFFHPGKDYTGSSLAALAVLPSLERLTVAGSLEFGDAGMEAVSALTQLKEFRTWHSGVTNEGVKKLRALKNLTGLTLGQRLSSSPPTTLADESLAVLAEMPSLEALALQEARLTLPALAQLKKLPKLKRLTLDGIDIAESDVVALKQQLPQTDVRWTAPTDANKKRIEVLFQATKP